jgi:serine/threonine protein kinase
MKLEIKTLIPNSIFGDFSRVRELTLGPLRDGGGFGKVYPAVKVHNKRTAQLVVKILYEGADGDRCYETAKRLQSKLKYLHQSRYVPRGESLADMAALSASPQFCFEGELEGKAVKGYAMQDLSKLGYVCFETITETKDEMLRAAYNQLEIGAKLRIAQSLVIGLKLLAELYYVHADLNPLNLFVHLKSHAAAIIDFDGGAIMDGLGEAPTTLGRITDGEWLAPEIFGQLASVASNRSIRISLLTDFWSVAVTIHYILFLRGPYFFLQRLARQDVLAYLNRYEWCDAGPGHPSIDASKLALHADYADYVSQLPNGLMERFRKAFNEGYMHPALRPTSSQWMATLTTALASKPTIASFKASDPRPIEGQPIKVRWSILDEYETLLDGDDVSGTQEIELCFNDPAEITLEARGIGGAFVSRKLSIKVQKYPKIFAFQASNVDVGEGQSVVLRWDARYHQALWLNGESLPKDAKEQVVFPASPKAEYILTSKNPIGDAVSQVIAIEVHKPPALHRFWTDRKAVTSQDTITLFWEAAFADEIEFCFQKLVDYRSVESCEVISAANWKMETKLDASCEIYCIARSKYGSAKLGPLRVEVVYMPQIAFAMQPLLALPSLSLSLGAIGLESSRIVFPLAERRVQEQLAMPLAYGDRLQSKSRQATQMFVIGLCLALVSGVIGYFMALTW